MAETDKPVKVSELITFTDKVEDVLLEEMTARKEILEFYTKTDEGKTIVRQANAMFNYLDDLVRKKNNGISMAEIHIICECEDYKDFKIFAMYRDPDSGDKLRYAAGPAKGGKIEFTDDEFLATPVGGTFFHADGVILRVVNALYDGVSTRVIRVELPSIKFPKEISQLWAYQAIKGQSTTGFRVDGTQIYPLEGLPQAGVSAGDRAKFDSKHCDIKFRN